MSNLFMLNTLLAIPPLLTSGMANSIPQHGKPGFIGQKFTKRHADLFRYRTLDTLCL